MQRAIQKTLAVFLALLIMLSAMSVSVFAAADTSDYTSGEGCFVAKRTVSEIRAYRL